METQSISPIYDIFYYPLGQVSFSRTHNSKQKVSKIHIPIFIHFCGGSLALTSTEPGG